MLLRQRVADPMRNGKSNSFVLLEPPGQACAPHVGLVSHLENKCWSIKKSEAVSKLIRFLLGAVLLVAASLKAHAVLTDSLKGELLGIPTIVQVIAVQVEFLLAIWLFSGYSKRLALTSAAIFFAGAAGIAGNLVLAREASCGCFGAIDVHPVITFTLDVALFTGAIVALLASRKERVRQSIWPTEVWTIAGCTVVLLLVPVVATSFGLIDFDSLMRNARGEHIALEPRVVHLGTVKSGSGASAFVSIVNLGSESINVIGGTADFGCVVYDDLPLTISARSSARIRVSITPRWKAGVLRQRFTLFTNHQGQPRLFGGIVGTVATNQNTNSHQTREHQPRKELP
jgi:hypothetical protein